MTVRSRPLPIRLIGFVVLAAALTTTAELARADEGTWETIKVKDGIQVSRRHVEGSPFVAFRGRGVVDAPPARVIAVVHDATHATEWMHQCVASWVIEKVDDRHDYTYSRSAAPWPVNARDVVLRTELVFNPAQARAAINFVSVLYPQMPPQDGVVRMPFLRGHWYFWPENGGRSTRVEYQVHADPGGEVPGWIANEATKDIPLLTVEALRRQVSRAVYQEGEAQISSMPDYANLLKAAEADGPQANAATAP